MMMPPKTPKERARDIVLDALAAIRDGLPATAARAALRLHELEHEEIDDRLRGPWRNDLRFAGMKPLRRSLVTLAGVFRRQYHYAEDVVVLRLVGADGNKSFRQCHCFRNKPSCLSHQTA